MNLKRHLLSCAILFLCIHALSTGTKAGDVISRQDDRSFLISTPIPVWAIDHPWYRASWDDEAIERPVWPKRRPPERRITTTAAGENLTAVSLYLSNDFTAPDAITLVGQVQNTGASTADSIVVRFTLGHPQQGGTRIGDDRIIGSLASGGTACDSVSWGGCDGVSKIYFVADAGGQIDETDETDNIDSLTVGMVDQVPWVWQEVNGYCHYASQTMLFNDHGAGNTVYETLELACCPHSVAYQDDELSLLSGWMLSQGIGDIEFAGQIRNLSTDLVIKSTWTSYLTELRRRIDAGQPCETSVDPFWLPQPDYDLLRSYGLHSGHGVVIVGYTGRAIIVNDPGVGLALLEEPAIPQPENRGTNVVVDEATFRNAVEWTSGSSYLLLSYEPAGAMPTHPQMLTRAVDRSLWRLGGDAGTFDPSLWGTFDLYGRHCFPALRDDASPANFQRVFDDAMSLTGHQLADALNFLATCCDLWGCGICWNAAAVFYGAQSYPQASRLSDLSARLSGKGDQAWEEFVDLLNAIYINGGNTGIDEPYLSRMRSILDEITPLEDSVLVEMTGLYGHLTAVEDGERAERLPPRPEMICYPNPFNGRTVIRFDLPEDGPVRLAVYNILGQRVAVLADGHRPAGPHRIPWDGRDDRGDEVSSGLYFCRLEHDGMSRNAKMLLLK